MSGEELLEFPCDYSVKAMGYATEDFEDHVVGLVTKHASLATPRQVTTKESSGGRYLSVTVSVEARSREHLELIYSDLKADKRVVFIL
jgi:putative lipoic acid-binding regulatory protein